MFVEKYQIFVITKLKEHQKGALFVYFFKANSLLIFLNSIATKSALRITATISAQGPEYKMPFIPKKRGKMSKNGTKQIMFFDKDKNAPLIGLPIAVKNVEAIGWIKFMKMKNI